MDEDPGWAARDLVGLFSACLRLAEFDLLEVGHGLVELNRKKSLPFTIDRKTEAFASVSQDHPLREDPFESSLHRHLRFRWEVIDDPSLWSRELEWIW